MSTQGHSRSFQINTDRGKKFNKKYMNISSVSLKIGNDIIMSGDAIRDLGVMFDSELSMQRHVNKVTQ